MARKVQFPLELKDGYLARSNIEEVRTHFDLEKIIAQFHNGRLKIWLDDHYLPEMAEQVAALDGDAPDLAARLCAVLGVEGVATEHIDSRTIQKRETKRQILSQYTTNPILCDMAEFAAFEQSDLDRLIKEGAQEIILCKENFRIPLNVKNKTYLGVGNAVAVIDSKTAVDFETLGIRFVDVSFDERYLETIADVRFINRGRKSFKILLSNGNTTDMDNPASWDETMGLTNVRLFLLLIGCLIGNCEYEFTEEELNKLNLVTLESLENRPITNYL